MSKNINIAIVGLGQIGAYLYNELKIKKNEIESKTGKKIKVVAISAKNINKKRPFKIEKKIFYNNPLKLIKENNYLILELKVDEAFKYFSSQVVRRFDEFRKVLSPSDYKKDLSRFKNQLKKNVICGFKGLSNL